MFQQQLQYLYQTNQYILFLQHLRKKHNTLHTYKHNININYYFVLFVKLNIKTYVQ